MDGLLPGEGAGAPLPAPLDAHACCLLFFLPCLLSDDRPTPRCACSCSQVEGQKARKEAGCAQGQSQGGD